jgi:hypothetical protein
MITYTTDTDPTQTGVYACRVPMDDSVLMEDKFLMWFEGRWSYPGSDQRYRGEVIGWVGPLQRKIVKAEVNHNCCRNPGWCSMPYDECGKHVYWR